MFAADHDRAAEELTRVVRPGGRIAVASWTRPGFVGGILGIVGQHVSPPPGAQSPVRWGEEDVVAELLGDRVDQLTSTVHTVTQTVPRRGGVRRPLPHLLRAHPRGGRTTRRRPAAPPCAPTWSPTPRRTPAPGADGVVTDWEYRVVRAVRR